MPHRLVSLFSSTAFVAVLGIALGIQIYVWRGQQHIPDALPSGPRPGSPVPALLVRSVGESSTQRLPDLLSAGGTCTLLVIISPTCPTCARMRVTWPARFSAWVDSVGKDVRPLWLSEGGESALLAFTRGYTLGDIDLASLPTGTTMAAYRDLGVLGTPTLYLVDTSGSVVAGLIGDTFPPVDLARRSCA